MRTSRANSAFLLDQFGPGLFDSMTECHQTFGLL